MTLRPKTKAYIVHRALQSAVPVAALNLECNPDEARFDVVEVSILWEGAVDEDFYMDHLYAVNTADWIGELLLGEYKRSTGDSLGFTVMVHEYVHEDAGSVVYSLTEHGAEAGMEAGPEWYRSQSTPETLGCKGCHPGLIEYFTESCPFCRAVKEAGQ